VVVYFLLININFIQKFKFSFFLIFNFYFVSLVVFFDVLFDSLSGDFGVFVLGVVDEVAAAVLRQIYTFFIFISSMIIYTMCYFILLFFDLLFFLDAIVFYLLFKFGVYYFHYIENLCPAFEDTRSCNLYSLQHTLSKFSFLIKMRPIVSYIFKSFNLLFKFI